jgi:hypothetical protein
VGRHRSVFRSARVGRTCQNASGPSILESVSARVRCLA